MVSVHRATAADPAQETSMTKVRPSIVSMRRIVETFGYTRAVNVVDFNIREGWAGLSILHDEN